MKTKDIKTLLNKETDKNTPDVLDNVKISPINKLKKNEKGLVAFKKTMATLILILLLVIVVVLSVAIHGYTTQTPASVEHLAFLSLRIDDGSDGNSVKAYNFIIADEGKILLAYDENNNVKLALPNDFTEILSLIDYNGESTIHVVSASDSPAFAKQFTRAISDSIEKDSRFDNAIVAIHSNDSSSRSIVSKALASLPGYSADEGESADTINKICALYLTLVG